MYIACFYTISLQYVEDEFIVKHILLKTHFSLFLFCFALSDYCLKSGLGGGGGENAVRCLVCSFFARDLLNLICLKYVGFLLICY